jgi:hypothetical protein
MDAEKAQREQAELEAKKRLEKQFNDAVNAKVAEVLAHKDTVNGAVAALRQTRRGRPKKVVASVAEAGQSPFEAVVPSDTPVAAETAPKKRGRPRGSKNKKTAAPVESAS